MQQAVNGWNKISPPVPCRRLKPGRDIQAWPEGQHYQGTALRHRNRLRGFDFGFP